MDLTPPPPTPIYLLPLTLLPILLACLEIQLLMDGCYADFRQCEICRGRLIITFVFLYAGESQGKCEGIEFSGACEFVQTLFNPSFRYYSYTSAV